MNSKNTPKNLRDKYMEMAYTRMDNARDDEEREDDEDNM